MHTRPCQGGCTPTTSLLPATAPIVNLLFPSCPAFSETPRAFGRRGNPIDPHAVGKPWASSFIWLKNFKKKLRTSWFFWGLSGTSPVNLMLFLSTYLTLFLFHEAPTLLGVNRKGAMRWPVDFYARGHPPGFPSPVLHCVFAI